jgi:uncharacterized protein (DUF2147 family)
VLSRFKARALGAQPRLALCRSFALVAFSSALIASAAQAQSPALFGYWREPGGAVIRIAPCGAKLCVWIVTLSRGKHPDTDTHNPDLKLRGRPLCELRIGTSFTQTDPQHADGGRLYDPRSGHTYSSSMTVTGDTLELRGYIGISLFGRTETWTRVRRAPKSCAASPRRT